MIKAESTTLVVMLTFGLTLAIGGASVTGTQILVDDFNDGNDQGWSQFDYTAGEPFGPATFEVRNGAYHIASQGGHDASFNDYLFSLWDAEGSDAPFRNGYLQARVSADNANTIVGVIMRGTVDEEGRLVGYGFAASAKYGVMIIKRCDGATSAFITSDPYIGFGPGNDWFFKAGAIDDRLDFKVWRAGQTEPPSPQLTVHNSTYTNGYVGVTTIQSVGAAFSPFGATFDDILFIPALLHGDVNVDGEVNGLDVDPFIDTLLSGEYQSQADMNEDQVVNGLDVNRFVAEVILGGTHHVPEPSTLPLALVATVVVVGWLRWKQAA